MPSGRSGLELSGGLHYPEALAERVADAEVLQRRTIAAGGRPDPIEVLEQELLDAAFTRVDFRPGCRDPLP